MFYMGKELIELQPFKDKLICPECMRITPRMTAPYGISVTSFCPTCPNGDVRRKNKEFEENVKNAKIQ
jgi:hypothetical protein